MSENSKNKAGNKVAVFFDVHEIDELIRCVESQISSCDSEKNYYKNMKEQTTIVRFIKLDERKKRLKLLSDILHVSINKKREVW